MLQSLIQEAGVLRPKARSKHANWIHTTFKNQRPIIFRILITTFYNHSLAPQKKKKNTQQRKKREDFMNLSTVLVYDMSRLEII